MRHCATWKSASRNAEKGTSKPFWQVPSQVGLKSVNAKLALVPPRKQDISLDGNDGGSTRSDSEGSSLDPSINLEQNVKAHERLDSIRIRLGPTKVTKANKTAILHRWRTLTNLLERSYARNVCFLSIAIHVQKGGGFCATQKSASRTVGTAMRQHLSPVPMQVGQPYVGDTIAPTKVARPLRKDSPTAIRKVLHSANPSTGSEAGNRTTRAKTKGGGGDSFAGLC